MKTLFRNLIENGDFSKKEDPSNLPEMFSKVKKGRPTYKKILLSNPGIISKPLKTIETRWRISEKSGRENFFGKGDYLFMTWECWTCLPSYSRTGKIK